MRISLRKTFARALILAGALALIYWGYLFVAERWFQRTADHVLEQQMLDATGVLGRGDKSRNQVLAQPRPGDIIGRIEIPRIHVSVIVLEGSDSRILRVAAGQVQGTVLPGMIGNVGIAAHRATFFRASGVPKGRSSNEITDHGRSRLPSQPPEKTLRSWFYPGDNYGVEFVYPALREIRPNDMITLTSLHGIFRYRVDSMEIVDPNDVQVLHPTKEAELTLVTCYPFYYVGSAPKRFIVHTRRQG